MSYGNITGATLEQWSPWLFALSAVFLLVGAAHNGLAFLKSGYAFNNWLGLVLELGRLTALLGAAGLSVRVARQNAWLGNLGRSVASLAVVFVTTLITMATLKAAGVLADPIGVIGLGAYVLSVGTFLVVGIGIVRTNAYSRLIGGFLLANVGALLVVFFGRLLVPLGLVATVVPTIQVLLYLSVGYTLRAQGVTSRQTAPAAETTP
jgi:hypothetical protein